MLALCFFGFVFLIIVIIVTFTFSIHLSNMKIPNLSIKTDPTKGLTIHSTGLGIDGHADWHYREHSW